jgi:hypothetical protein
MNFNEAAAVWLKKRHPDIEPIVGTISFAIDPNWGYDGGDNRFDIDASWEEMHSRQIGRDAITHQMRLSTPERRANWRTLNGVGRELGITQMMREIVNIALSDHLPVSVPRITSEPGEGHPE